MRQPSHTAVYERFLSMTDISQWDSLVHVAQLRVGDIISGKPYEPPVFSRYIVVPLNEYQMGNLIDAIGQVQDTGDWYGEFCNIVEIAMLKAGISEITSNRGHKFTLGDVRSRNIRR